MTIVNNTVYLITGTSGSGKTTLMRSIMENELTSFTTRPMREGEVEGKDYYFMSQEEFSEAEKNGLLAEKTEYSGNYYGLTKDEIETKLKKGNAFFICDFNGANQIKELYNNCVSIFILSTKKDTILNMINRNDSMENIENRIKTYEEEIKNSVNYDYVVTNVRGKFEETRETIMNIIYITSLTKENL